jgi:hypothetical protein
MNTNRNFSARAEGSILIFVLIIGTILGAVTFALLELANAGLIAQRVEKDDAQALSNAFSGLEAARNRIETFPPPPDNYKKYPDGEYHNVVLWTADSSADGNPGASIVFNGIATVTVSYLGYSWYELRSTAIVGDVTRIVKLRVREKDYYSRYGTFIASMNEITIEDDESLYGSIHANNKIVFEDDITGVGANLFGLVTSRNPFTFNKNAQEETKFYAGYADNLGYTIPMPPVTKITELKTFTGAWGAGGTIIYSDDPNPKKAKVQFAMGPRGYSVVTSAPRETYIEFINSATNREKVKITIKDGATTLYPTGSATGIFDITPGGTLYEEPVIHVGGSANIAGIKGELNGRVTVCCESSISISADLVYEDDNDQKALLFDPGTSDPDKKYLPNENYTGTSALGMIAKNDILYTGIDDDADLQVNAAMIALTGDIKYSGTATKGWLCSFGSRCANGKIERCTSSNGYRAGGVHIYDEQGCLNPAPQFPSLYIPFYTGLEIVK